MSLRIVPTAEAGALLSEAGGEPFHAEDMKIVRTSDGETIGYLDKIGPDAEPMKYSLETVRLCAAAPDLAYTVEASGKASAARQERREEQLRTARRAYHAALTSMKSHNARYNDLLNTALGLNAENQRSALALDATLWAEGSVRLGMVVEATRQQVIAALAAFHEPF